MKCSYLLLTLWVLLAGCVTQSENTKQVRVDAFSDYLLFLRSNSVKQGDTIVVKVFASTLPLPIGMGDADTLILYKKGYDLTAVLPTHIVDTTPIIKLSEVNYKYAYYASAAHPASPLSCRIDNRGKKFVQAAVYDTSIVFQQRLHDGTSGFYRLADTVEAVTEFPCSFYLGKGYYMTYDATNIHYYGDMIIQY